MEILPVDYKNNSANKMKDEGREMRNILIPRAFSLPRPPTRREKDLFLSSLEGGRGGLGVGKEIVSITTFPTDPESVVVETERNYRKIPIIHVVRSFILSYTRLMVTNLWHRTKWCVRH